MLLTSTSELSITRRRKGMEMTTNQCWYVKTEDGKYLVDVTRTIRPLNIKHGIGQLTIEREYAEFSTQEEAEKARQETGCADICHVTDVAPLA